jgi:hypothetical protein
MSRHEPLRPPPSMMEIFRVQDGRTAELRGVSTLDHSPGGA